MQTYEAGTYDIIVVGGGHAGVEASLASARMGLSTLMVTMNLGMIGFMPCNPAIGGPAKGVVVRELDALGGEMGRNIDRTYIQMRQLNTSKGPAVRALRAQADRDQYSIEMKHVLETTENLTLKQAVVNELMVEDGECRGVITNTGALYRSQAVVLTTGTSSRGKILMGELVMDSGPNNSLPSIELAQNLLDLGIELIRFKTGTPARVHKKSLDFSKMEIQPGDEDEVNFSFMTDQPDEIEANEPCWLTHTNERTHQVIMDNIDRAPMFMGHVETKGARYCPSIEDKIHRFSDKPRHQVFLEPEGLKTEEMYVQGLSTSLPEEVQLEFLRTIPGMENVEIMRPGYAIEYDVVAPHQLSLSLEVQSLPGLFTAGQMNGTSGYEEAAGQGIMAGINAALKVQGKEPLILRRDEAYIGVMIDDLVTKGTTEPYRLLTSRAEHRLLLRHDNADLRLTEHGYQVGLASQERYDRYLAKKALMQEELDRLKTVRFTPNTPGIDTWFQEVESTPLQDGILAYDLLRRPEIKYEAVAGFFPRPQGPLGRDVAEQIEIHIKYEGYINKAQRKVDSVASMEAKQLPQDIDYFQIDNLKLEARERLSEIRPETLGQASRVSGVTASDIAILQVYLKQEYPQLVKTEA